MIERVLSYQFGDKYFYKHLANVNIGDELAEYEDRFLTVDKDSIFLYSLDSEAVKDIICGWKIHVSVSLDNYKNIIGETVPFLAERHIPFKIVKNIKIYSLLSQKAFPRESYGKYITIYPKNEDQFVSLIQELYGRLHKYEGPYILSDRQYKDCGVLYYRYGGIYPLSVQDGYSDIKTYIYDGYDRLVYDKRLPYFSLPNGIVDIFPAEIKHESLLLSKYNIQTALAFSNTGGVYLGTLKDKKEEYIIKEARPNTAIAQIGIDAIFLRKNEMAMLFIMEKYGYTPKAYEGIADSGHFFLIEEKVTGKSVKHMVMMENPIHYYGSGNKLNTYLCKSLTVLAQIVDFYRCLDNEGLCFDDLSLDNVMIDGETIKVVDLEGCFRKGSNLRINKYADSCFLDSNGEKNIISKFFFDLLFPKNNLYILKENAIEEFLKILYKKYRLPYGIENVFSLLKMGADWEEIVQQIADCKRVLAHYTVIKNEYAFVESAEDTINQQFISRLIKDVDLLKAITPDGKYAITPVVHNDCNILNSDVGIFLAKYVIENTVCSDYLYSLPGKFERVNNCGLYSGKYGAVWSCLCMGQDEQAIQLFNKVQFPYSTDYSIFSGVAGKGLIEVQLYLNTHDSQYLNTIEYDADYIVTGMNTNKITKIGFSEGKTGIALFLLYSYILIGKDEFYHEGKKMLESDLQKGVERESGLIDFPPDDRAGKASPYFWDGTAGIVAVLSRYAFVSQDKILIEKSHYYAQRMEYRQTMSPSLIYGMAGIGNTYLDCYYLLGDKGYLENAYECAETCRLYVAQIEGIQTFTDVFGLKYSSDYAFGTMGVLLFFNRLIKKCQTNFLICGDDILLRRRDWCEI